MAFGSEVPQVEQPALREKEETEIKDRFEEGKIFSYNNVWSDLLLLKCSY